jgi:site-specific DNA-cytosine methylase
MLWKGKKQPILNWINEPYLPLDQWPEEDSERVYPGKPSDDDLVAAIYKHYGSRRELYKTIDRPRTAFGLVNELGLKPKLTSERYKKLFARYAHKAVLDVTPVFVKEYTNALMWKVTTYMIHPRKDRYISIRELMSMMGLPSDYPTLPRNQMNVIFQNVPVNTVSTLVSEIKAALEGKRLWVKYPFMRVNNIKQKVESKAYTLQSLNYE